jgi:hypothetical protein
MEKRRRRRRRKRRKKRRKKGRVRNQRCIDERQSYRNERQP